MSKISQRKTIKRAASLLEAYADMLFNSKLIRDKNHPRYGFIDGADARREIAEHRRIAANLRAIAEGSRRRNDGRARR